MRAPRTVEAFAPAKLNLALHVTGRRADGYHLLDSLVAFAGVGDVLTLRRADASALDVTGPMAAGVPTDAGNLVLRAAGLFAPPVHVEITLEKHLPAAAGIGGGSSDAAACLLAAARLSGQPLPPADAVLSLGADVPVCLSHAPQRMRGIGDRLDPAPPLPLLWAVLVNPRLPVPTGPVFAALDWTENAALPDELPRCRTAADFCDWLSAQRNDLQPAALTIRPEIGVCLSALADLPGCLLARMSGSGATCFGLFASESEANSAAATLSLDQPGWWCTAAPLLRGGDPLTPRPQFSRATT